jgi:hypothetical protein
MAIIEAFPGCSLPPVLFGTGELFIMLGTDEFDLGNFSLVDFIQEGESRRTFRGDDEVASAVGSTSEYRLELTGDTFTPTNLARLLNEISITGDTIELGTVRDLVMYSLRFRKPLRREDCAPSYFDLFLWRTYLELPMTYTFSQDEQTVHRFVFIAVPDPMSHPANPLGEIVFHNVDT